jgi:hypothetical protein
LRAKAQLRCCAKQNHDCWRENKLLSWRGIDERSQESSARFRRRRRNQVEPEHLRQVAFVAKTRRETGCNGAGRQAHGEIEIAMSAARYGFANL